MTWRLPQSPCVCITRCSLHNLRTPLRGQIVRYIPEATPRPRYYSNSASARYPPKLRTHAQLKDETGVIKAGETNTEPPTIAIAGLVRSIRKQKKVAFAHVSDGSTLEPIQAILSPEQVKDITNGSYVELYGDWKESPGQGQARELHVSEVARLGGSNPEDFPIQKKTQTQEFLRTLPHLRFRTPLFSLVARARSVLIGAASEYYNSSKHHAIQVHPPLITSSDCEGAGEVFTISPRSSSLSTTTKAGEEEQLFFRDPKYLTVSSQLHLEAYSAELGDVWALSPTFRAEESDTPRHLAEFYMLEAEFRSIISLTDLMNHVENLIKSMIATFQESPISKELENYHSDPKYQSEGNPRLNRDSLHARWSVSNPTEKWQRMSYASAIQILKSHHAESPGSFTYKPSYADGLHLEHERHLVEFAANNKPLFVTDYPRHIKPFYMLPSTEATDYDTSLTPTTPDENQDTVSCFDLLFPHGTAELVGGSLREHRLPNLISSMRDKGILKPQSPSPSPPISFNDATYPHLHPHESLGSLTWYADLRRFGSAPHGGFGMGFDRLLAYLVGVSSVRDTVGFPRWHGRADC